MSISSLLRVERITEPLSRDCFAAVKMPCQAFQEGRDALCS